MFYKKKKMVFHEYNVWYINIWKQWNKLCPCMAYYIRGTASSFDFQIAVLRHQQNMLKYTYIINCIVCPHPHRVLPFCLFMPLPFRPSPSFTHFQRIRVCESNSYSIYRSFSSSTLPITVTSLSLLYFLMNNFHRF